MKSYGQKTVCVISIVVIVFFIAGCGEAVRPEVGPGAELGTTIGSLVEVFAPELIAVEGYGLVGGLMGTGSGECPRHIRAYLKQYILAQLPERKMDVEKFISSRNTAVVLAHGTMPTAVTRNQYFDVKVEALPGTQTTSLEGGWLYRAELKATVEPGVRTRALATAEGAVFIDTIGTRQADKTAGYILAGGKVLDEYRITLGLRQPDYMVSRRISDLINLRFGSGAAKPVSPGVIELTVPAEYGEQKQRFISTVKAIYIIGTPQITEERIDALVRKLADSEDKGASEAALEAIGNKCLGRLANVLNSSNEEVRFRAARCMLNLGGDRGLATLRAIAMDKGSGYRVEALEAITAGASRDAAATIARRLVRDDDFDIRLAAYEQLRKLDDIAITQRFIADKFYLEQIAQVRPKEIFVSRSGQPRIVLFGAPIYCRDNVFVQSADGNITINAPSGQNYVSVIRKLPNRPNVIELQSSFELSDIIQTLCEEPAVKDGSVLRAGLNISYADAIAILKQMCQTGQVPAVFRPGPLPKID